MKQARVLHVLGAMNRGGVETWLLHLLRHYQGGDLRMDLLVHTHAPAAYDEEALALGAHLYRNTYTANPIRYAGRFLQIVRDHGPFDVLHSHVHYFSGLALTLGRIAGIPVRIAHSHNDTRKLDVKPRLSRLAYQTASRGLILANATHGLAVSQPAAASLFGENWQQDRRLQVLYCGIDLTPFQIRDQVAAIRSSLGFSKKDIVFGHVGRFDPQKNHTFLIEVAAQIAKSEGRAKFLLVGDGPLRAAAEKQVRSLHLQNLVVFAGSRADVPSLMVHAMDAFLLPSVLEGLPLVVMEAQAAALGCVVSAATPAEAIVNPAMVERLPLSAGPRHWAKVAIQTALRPRFDRQRALDEVGASPFAIAQGARRLAEIYLAEPDKRRSGGVVGYSSRETNLG